MKKSTTNIIFGLSILFFMIFVFTISCKQNEKEKKTENENKEETAKKLGKERYYEYQRELNKWRREVGIETQKIRSYEEFSRRGTPPPPPIPKGKDKEEEQTSDSMN